MTSSNRNTILIAILSVIMVIAATYVWMNYTKTPDPVSTNPSIISSWDISPTTPVTSSGVTIFVPENASDYTQKMTDFVQIGGEDPLKTQIFIAKHLAIPYTDDIQKASAEAAAQQFPGGGWPEKVLVHYLKVENWTAYIVLNIDQDGRAGVSVAIAKIHPVVEKTLLQFPDIQRVVFGYTAADKPNVQ